LDYLDRVSSKAHYSTGFWKGRGKFAFCIGRASYRVELYFSDDSDKVLFDAMYQYKDEIQAKHDGVIEWERLENKKASRIKFEIPSEIYNNLTGRFSEEQSWNDIVDWYTRAMKHFYSVVYPFWEKVQKSV